MEAPRLTLLALPDEPTLVRYVLFALALGAVAYGIWRYLKSMPPGREPSWAPVGRR